MSGDMQGNSFHIGCKVVRPISDSRLKICTVTKIQDGKIYLDGSKYPMKYPSRLVIIEQDPLYKMVKNYSNENN